MKEQRTIIGDNLLSSKDGGNTWTVLRKATTAEIKARETALGISSTTKTTTGTSKGQSKVLGAIEDKEGRKITNFGLTLHLGDGIESIF